MTSPRLRLPRAIAIILVLVSASFGIAGSVQADAPPPPPRHATDAVVRTEMKAIRDIVLRDHSLVTHRRMPPAAARAFQAALVAAVKRMEGASLTPEARSDLGRLTTSIVRGADAVAGKVPEVTPIDGIVMIDEALAGYAASFDHPDWEALRPGR